MIMVDLESGFLSIAHTHEGELEIVENDAEAHIHIEEHFKGHALLGTFPDPSKYVKTVLESAALAAEIKKPKPRGRPKATKAPKPVVTKEGTTIFGSSHAMLPPKKNKKGK